MTRSLMVAMAVGLLLGSPALGDNYVATNFTETPIAVAPETRRIMLTPPNIEREGYQEATAQDLTAEMLEGIAVYGPEDESVGEIGELILDDGGRINEAVIDVGGFLGVEERNVAVMFEELRVLRQDDSGDVRVYIDCSEKQLEQLPEYQG